MPLSDNGDKHAFMAGDAPLAPTEIKILLLDKNKTIATLAARWNTTSAVLSRIVNRRGPYVYMRERRLLARYLGVAVHRIGREPNWESPKSRVRGRASRVAAAA